MHTTTNFNKPPDICVDDNDKVSLRTVAPATACLFSNDRFGRNWVSSWHEKGAGVFPPPRRSALLGCNNRVEGDKGVGSPESNVRVNSPANEASSGPPETLLFIGSTTALVPALHVHSRVISRPKRDMHIGMIDQ